MANSTITIWKLFFTDEMIQAVVENTNDYAERCLLESPHAHQRSWRLTPLPEMHAFMATQVYLGLHPESEVSEYWNLLPRKGPLHTLIIEHICLR